MGKIKGKMIILSGPSGVGKGSINSVLEQDKSLNLKYSVSMTTRAQRPGEVDGLNYFFVDKETFEDAIEHGELIEYAEFIGNYYGTPRKFVYDEMEKGNNVILEIEVKGATKVLENEPKEDIISIFLMPPSLTMLEERLRKRGTESNEIIKQRLDKALIEIPLKHKYKYVIENDNIENAVAKIKDVFTKERCINLPFEQSYYYKLKQDVEQIISNRYNFILENWKLNITENDLSDYSSNFDFKSYLVEIMTNSIYNNVLENEIIRNLNDIKFVEKKLERAMLDVNFFSIEQSI